MIKIGHYKEPIIIYIITNNIIILYQKKERKIKVDRIY